MNAKVSYTSYDYEPVTIVPVVASFDTSGHVRPMYVRLYGQVYKIDSFWEKSALSTRTEYICKIIDGDCLKPLTLTYCPREGMWTIPAR